MSTFIRLTDVPPEAKAATLARVISGEVPDRVFDFAPDDLRRVTGSPFAYWVKEKVRAAFEALPPLESGNFFAKLGASTKNDFRYLRLSWEVSGVNIASTPDARWVYFVKGGAYAKYYGETSLVIPWRGQVREIDAELNQKFPYLNGNTDFVLHRNDPHFHPGITWSSRTQKGLGMRIMQPGCVFSHKGPAIFSRDDNQLDILALLAVVNSKPFVELIKLSMTFGSYEVGVIQKTPVPTIAAAEADTLAALSKRAWSLHRRKSTYDETARAFVLPEKLTPQITAVVPEEIDAISSEIDGICWPLFGFAEADLGPTFALNELANEDDESDEDVLESDLDGDWIAGILSWSVGVAFGRFDIRLATGERPIPPEPAPFDPLPAKSLGMLPDGDPPFMPCDGVFVDDPGHKDDLATRVIDVYERVGETVPAEPEMRRTLAREFFPAHIRMYSKSRRKAPIYWQLATPSASYSVWLYIHAFGKDTLFRVQKDYVAPKLDHERRRLEELQAEAGPSPSAAQSRAIEAQAAFVEDLSAMLDEVKRVVPLWDPDLDDGVIINFAPLWRLVPQNRAWQKELRATWEALAAGEYDWAHLSMRLWPERVVPKCAKDRSLAIAHGLEEVFWVEGADGKWTARAVPQRPVQDIIAERSSSAVKAALASLIEAPEPIGATRRGRGSR